MPKEEKNKLTGHKSWIRFRNRVSIALGIFALITLYFSFYFVGPLSGKVVDAKTGEPIANIEVEYIINGSQLCFFLAHSCPGWDKRVNVLTDDNGKFKIPLSTEKKLPFIEWLNHKNRIYVNEYGNKNYDDYEQDVLWPFNLKFKLVPTPKTLDDCRDNLTEKEQYRCVKMLADRDAREINKIKINAVMDDYYISKYLHIIKNYCNNADSIFCTSVKAFYQKNKNLCNNDKLCLFPVAIDLRDKLWCDGLPSIQDPYAALSIENCKYIIDTLTAEDK